MPNEFEPEGQAQARARGFVGSGAIVGADNPPKVGECEHVWLDGPARLAGPDKKKCYKCGLEQNYGPIFAGGHFHE